MGQQVDLVFSSYSAFKLQHELDFVNHDLCAWEEYRFVWSKVAKNYGKKLKLRPCIEKFSPSLSLKKSPRTLAMPDFVLNLLHKTPKKKS